jgi:hypothetical protein
MKHPSFDADGYPTEETLMAIRDWPLKEQKSLIEFLKICFRVYGRVEEIGDRIEIATGGWSGNEDCIHFLKDNSFWHLNWQSSHRGGLYCFDLPKDI